MAAADQLMLQHHADRQQFVFDTHVGRAHVDYRIDAGLLSVLSTFVPPALRGKGIAAQLTEAVLEYCRREQLALRPVCSYTVSYLKQHPQPDLSIRS